MSIKEQIEQKLKDIEKKEGVRILLAVESGSRAWGFDSPDSDYDVRFIYVHPREWYLSLKKGRDVIEELDPEGLLDVSGWDVMKALSLMSRGNCAIVEWLGSPVVYYKDENFLRDVNAIKDLCFREVSAVNHYYHLAMNHDRRYLEKRGCELKRFLYHIRGLLAAQWCVERGTYPPVPFMELVEAVVKDDHIMAELKELVKLKSESREHDQTIVSDALIEYATKTKQEIARLLNSLPSGSAPDIEEFDSLLLREINKTHIV